MKFNYDYYIAASVVLLVLIIYHFTVPRVKNLASHVYVGFLILCFASCVTDILWGVIYVEYFPENVVLNYLGQLACFITQHMIPPLYYIYMRIISRDLEKIDRRSIYWMIPALSVQVMLLTNHMTGVCFTYTVASGYRRGPEMWYLITVSIFYLLASIVEVLWHGKDLGNGYRVSSFAFLAISVVLLIIQMIYSRYVLVGAAAALSSLIMQLTLQNPKMIREAKEKERQARLLAEETSRSKSAFLANMSHEIRTPMNAICGMAEILENCDLRPIEKEYIRTIQDAGASLLDIIDDVLDFSKIDAGKQELVVEEYEFDKMILGVEEIIAARMQKKDIRFEINMPSIVPAIIKGDKGKVRQILINILGNAVKFTEKGKIVLDISYRKGAEKDGIIEFLVTDTGIGIRKEDLSKLFNQFSQVDTMRNRKVEGTGLGLVLSRGLARLMGGDITVSSVYGVGSSFKITIHQEIVKECCLEQLLEGQQYRAYIYDDDYDERWYLTRILSKLGVRSVFLSTLEQFEDLEKQKRDTEKSILFYSFEKKYQEIQKKNLPMKTIALLEYYSVSKEAQNQQYYIRKPFDVFRLSTAVKSEYMAPFVDKSVEISEEKTAVTQDTEAVGTSDLLQTQDVHIAVVDDNKVNLRVAMTLLRQFGVLPEAFSSGERVLKALKMGRKYDIIFMDHMMPEMDGVEVTQKIRQMPGYSKEEQIIIALTANAIDGVEQEYLKAGMNDWLFKPVRGEQLQKKLIKYLPSEKILKTTGE